MTEIVKTKLLFLDSDSVVNSRGGIDTSFDVQIPSGQIQAGQGQFMRISLQNFSMLKNFYNLNRNNNSFAVRSQNNPNPPVDANGVTVDVLCAVTPGDYQYYNGIVTSIAKENNAGVNSGQPPAGTPKPGWWNTNLKDYLNNYEAVGLDANDNATGTVTWADPVIEPDANLNSLTAKTRIMKMTFTGTPASGATKIRLSPTNKLIIQCRNHKLAPNSQYGQLNDSDSYEIFGGRRVTDPADLTTESFLVEYTDTTVTITGYYPMQRFTQEHVYMHSDIAGSNYASRHFNQGSNLNTLTLDTTTLFAKMLIGNEVVAYDSNQHQDYFFDYFGDNLTHLQIFLTDCDGRAIPLVFPNQATLGNMNFTMVLRVDVLAYGATGFDKLVGPLDNLMDISSDVRRTLVTQGKPMWRNIPGPPGLNGQFFAKQPAAPPQAGDHPSFPTG